MVREVHDQQDTAHNESSFARRSYKIYLEHFKSRNLNPTMTMEEFMANYATERFSRQDSFSNLTSDTSPESTGWDVDSP